MTVKDPIYLGKTFAYGIIGEFHANPIVIPAILVQPCKYLIIPILRVKYRYLNTDDFGQKPIHLAAQSDKAEVVKMFLKQRQSLVSVITKVSPVLPLQGGDVIQDCIHHEQR